MTINLDDQNTEVQINLDHPNQISAVQSLPSDAIEDRSAIASIGLSNTTGITQSQFREAIQNGQEDNIRKLAASRINDVKISMAKDKIAKDGDRLSNTELQTMLKAQDPNSVFEEHYAKAYMNYLNWPKDNDSKDNWAWTVADTHPEAWDYVKQQGEEFLAKSAYMHDKFQDAYGHSHWYDTASTMLKDLGTLGFYGELKQRTGIAGTGVVSGGLGLGTNIDEQARKAWDLPFPEFKQVINQAVSNMPPDVAATWLKAMIGQTTNEKFASNAFTALNALGVGQVGVPLTKSAISAAFRNAPTFRMARAVADVVTTPRPASIDPSVAGPAVAGNLEQASVNKVVIQNINELSAKNNPIKDLTERMTGNYNVLNNDIASNPGDLGREGANRLSDMVNSNKEGFVSTIMSMMLKRGDRTPNISAYLADIKKGIADQFRGPDHTVLNVSDPIYVPGLNVRAFNVPIGTFDASLFNSEEEAIAFARRQGWPVKGDYNVPPERVGEIARREALVRSLRTAASRATTSEGAATANARADKVQAELNKIPRHDTGITIESQPNWDVTRDFYSSRVGPEAPRKPADALKSTEGNKVPPKVKASPAPSQAQAEPPSALTPAQRSKLETFKDLTRQELEGARKDLVQEDNPKLKANHERRIARLEKDLSETDNKLNPKTERPKSTFLADLDAKLGHEATWDEIMEAWGKEGPNADLIPREGFVPKGERQQKGKPFKITKEPLDLRDLPEDVIMRVPPRTKEAIDAIKQTSGGTVASKATITQQGNGYYILHTVYLPEEKDFVRDGLVNSKVGGLPLSELRNKLKLGQVSTGIPNDWAGGWVNALLGTMRSPAERLSTAENLNRIIATHGPSVLLGMAEDGSKPIAQMPKKYWGDFNRFVRYLQNAWNEETKTPGIWVNTPFDVQDWYLRNIKRAPDATEIQAYFAYRTLMVDDLNLRNLAVMQRKLIMGAKQWAVSYADDKGKTVTTPFFEGVEQDKFPESGRVLKINSQQRDGTKWRLARGFGNEAAQIEEDVASGRAKIIRIFDPKSNPIAGVHDNGRPADYVVSYVNQQKPLGYDHVNATGGGHLIPKWGWFLKQADIESYFTKDTPSSDTIEGKGITAFRKYLDTPNTFKEGDAYHVYNGDKTLFSFKSKAEAEAAIAHLEEVRKTLVEHVKQRGNVKPSELQRWENEGGAIGPDFYSQAADQAKFTGVPFQKLVDWWVGPNAPYNVNQPIRAVPMGGKIIDLNNDLRDAHPGLIDATKDGSLLGKAMVGFTQERDMEGLYTLRRTGTESAPAYAYEPAPLIDPITAMERGYGGIVRSMYTYDMKKYSIEHWVEQARPWLQNPDDIRNNPLSVFTEPKYLANTPYEIRANLESNRKMAADFVGLGDRTSNSLNSMAQAISDYIYRNSKGERQVLALYDLPKTTDWTQWIRNVAFYSSQISLKTFFTQASTLSNIYFIAGPQQATKATAAMTMYGWWKIASGKPEILEGMDRSLSRYMGWQPGRFTEAVQMMEGSGFHNMDHHVMKEGMSSAGLQWAEDVTPVSIGWRTISNFGRTLLDYGSIPFNAGAATTRRAAFFTAYLETLEKAPGGVIDRILSDAMLGRASLLDANMSSAFNSKLNKGLLSIPFQFESYDQRMMELMWGKQLTRQEKMSLFASSSVMFGLRGGFYGALGLPIANYVLGKTETALGYVPNENPLADLVVNGFPSWMFAMLSGFTDSDGKKTWVDFSKWGNRGVQAIEDFIDTEKSMADFALGAFGGTFGQAWQNTWGMRKAFTDSLKPDGYKLTSSDVLQAFKTLSLVSDINKAYLAFQTGKLLTRNDTYVTDIGPIMATIQGLTGLSPIASSDVWIKQKQLTAQDKDVKEMQHHVSQEIMRSAMAGDQNDPMTATVHLRNARAMLEYIPVEKWNQTVQEAFRAIGFSAEKRVDMKLFRDHPEQLIRNFTGK
jgi:hypothetical protein